MHSCPSCGGTDHQRRSSKLCPHYRPRLSRLHAESEHTKTSTVTVNIGFETLLADNHLKETIQDRVYRASDIFIEGARALLGFVLHQISNQRPIPDIRFGAHGLMRQFFAGVGSTHSQTRNVARLTRRNTDVENFFQHHYTPLRPQELSWTDIRGMDHTIAHIAHQYHICCKNHVVSNLPRKLALWFKHKLRKMNYGMSEHQLSESAQIAMNALVNPNDLAADMQSLQLKRKPRRRIRRCVKKVRDKLGGLPFETKTMESRWHEYLPLMAMILKTFTKNTTHYSQNQKGPQLRLFSLLPVPSFKTKHLLIDTQVLRDIINDANLDGLVVPGCGEFQTEAMEWWQRFFNIKKVTTAQRRFAYSISTDGVQCCVHLTREKIVMKENDYGFKFDKSGYQPLEIGKGTKVIGIDPNIGLFFGAFWGHDERYHDFNINEPDDIKASRLVYKTSRWRHESGAIRSTHKSNQWIDSYGQGGEMRTTFSQLPTPCTSDWAGYTLHLTYVFAHYNYIVGFFRQKKWRRLRWKTFIRRQKAYVKVANMLKQADDGGKFDPTTIVVYGGHYKSGFNRKGPPPPPNKK